MDAARLIRDARTRSGLTLRQLAGLAATSDATLSAYETGRVTPRADTLTRIVEAAGWSLDTDLGRLPVRDPRRASPGEELFSLLELVEFLPSRTRAELPPAPHAIFGRK